MTKLNWPTAFVIVALIFAGAFVYNKPTGAAFVSNETIASGDGDSFFHLKDGKVRLCFFAGFEEDHLCSQWSSGTLK